MRIFLILFIAVGSAWGYPNFVSKGYMNCLTCHYNPYGNGPLNDYGRAVAASALADRLFISDKTSDDELGKRSGFLFNTPKNRWFRPSLDYRSLYIAGGLNNYDEPGEAFEEAEWIHMQMDANITLKFGKRDNLIISGTYGVIPHNSGFTPDEDPEYISREHYIGYRPSKEWGFYAGKMDKIFGIRVPDHNALSKRLTNTNLSPTHGVVLHYLEKNYELGGQVFDGDKDLPEEEQTSGFAARGEYNVFDTVRVGLNYMQDGNEDSTKYMKAFLTKAKVGKASSIMVEAGLVDNEIKGGDTTTSQYLFMQNHIYIKRGLYYLTTFERAIPDTSDSQETLRITPGIQYFPFQRFEVRAELQNQRTSSEEGNIEDSWSFLGQMHLWF